MNKVLIGLPGCLILAVSLMGTQEATAYPNWNDCTACHGDFRAANYVSPSDGQNWGNLHNLHRNTMLSGDCNTCHGNSLVPIILDSSKGGAGFEAIGCMGCHGRNEDIGGDGLSMGRGAGLRQHHFNSGIAVCANCHSDSNPANYVTVGENIPPSYYFTPDSSHPNKPTDSCSPNGEEDYAGLPDGLDGDGDGLYGTNDPDCAAPTQCGNGILEPGEACDDGNILDGDCCSAICTFEVAGSACADGNACNGDETCNGSGTCDPGLLLNCDDANVCTDDVCDPAIGCVNTNNMVACDDFDACTVGDTCGGGVCVSGSSLSCDDGNVCTDDVCDPAIGCVNTNNMVACDDFDACTVGDTCGGGVCVSGGPLSCDDGLFCNGMETCDPAAGCMSPGDSCPLDTNCNEVTDTCDPIAQCGDGVLDPVEQCDDGNILDGDCCSANCTFEVAGSACADGNACNGDETCNGAGTCDPGLLLNCDDANVCTDDVCDPAIGCVNTNNMVACDDFDACTVGDTCGGGVCVSGSLLSCADGNVCTDDACDPAIGCVNTNNMVACDDGDACTAGDNCGGGVCVSGSPLSCDDGLFCNGMETCDPAVGCMSAGNPCPTGTICTEISGTCDLITACGDGVLDPGETCDDGNVLDGDCCSANCTFEAAGTACSDGDACNGDETCNGAGICDPGQMLICDDGNVCTDDICDLSTGCVYTNNTVACDDNDACTLGDTCGGGDCLGGSPLNCADGNVCTDDTCDAVIGCVNTNNTLACDDGDACTVGDTCDVGICVGGGLLSCDDGQFCNGVETCDSIMGCVSLGGPCPLGTICNEMIDTCDPVGGGQMLYAKRCGYCHGGFDQNPQVSGIKVLGARPCSINGAIYGTDAYPGGVPSMQSLQGMVTQDEIIAISEYLNSQTVTPMERYATACSGCHGIDANGGIFDEGVRGEGADDIYEAIYDEDGMQFLDCLTDSDIDMIGDYLRSLVNDDDDGDDDDGDDDDDDDDDDDGDGDDDDDDDEDDSEHHRERQYKRSRRR